MPSLTFYPLGNADSCRIHLANNDQGLFDFGAMRDPNDKNDKRFDLLAEVRKDIDLLFKENVSYGFRRNALGLKPLGLIISIVSLLWALVAADVLFGSTQKYIDIAALSQMPAPAVSCLTLSALMIVVWLVFFTRTSLRTAAFTYAEMLLRACETL